MILLRFFKATGQFAICSFMVLLFSTSGCAPVISKELREQVAPDVTFTEVSRNPDLYAGKTVLWAGVILKGENTKDGTLLEILQTPAGFRGSPGDIFLSKGKFLALNKGGHLDSNIYTKGRGVTVAGEIQGVEVPLLPSAPPSQAYYPLILAKEIHPWPGKNRDSIYNRHYYWAPWALP